MLRVAWTPCPATRNLKRWDQVELKRPFDFFLSALPLRKRDLRSFALRAAFRRAVLRRLLRDFIADSFSTLTFAGRASCLELRQRSSLSEQK